MYLEQKQDVIKESRGNMVKFAAAGYVCVDYYPDFNNRYYITGNGSRCAIQSAGHKKGKDMEASIISAVSDDEYGKKR